ASPDRITQYDHIRTADPVFLIEKRAAHFWASAEQPKIIRGKLISDHNLRLTRTGQRVERVTRCGYVLENAVLRLPLGIFATRDRGYFVAFGQVRGPKIG